ncbi:hypothetical protein [Candidatus Poriferisodalis sp.]|uniref:hypothetical protein n=1 Tax=Candidatus Poriferisodalis sp. TaxID=3101277 RepID=UPI003B0116D7
MSSVSDLATGPAVGPRDPQSTADTVTDLPMNATQFTGLIDYTATGVDRITRDGAASAAREF